MFTVNIKFRTSDGRKRFFRVHADGTKCYYGEGRRTFWGRLNNPKGFKITDEREVDFTTVRKPSKEFFKTIVNNNIEFVATVEKLTFDPKTSLLIETDEKTTKRYSYHNNEYKEETY